MTITHKSRLWNMFDSKGVVIFLSVFLLQVSVFLLYSICRSAYQESSIRPSIGLEIFSNTSRFHRRFDNDVLFPDVIKKFYISLPLHIRRKFPNPFAVRGNADDFLYYINSPKDESTFVTRIVEYIYTSSLEIQTLFPEALTKRQCAFLRWFVDHGSKEYGLIDDEFIREPRKFINARYCELGVNVCGYPKGEFGIGETSRSTARSLINQNISISLTNIPGAEIVRHEDDLLEKEFGLHIENLNPYQISIVHDDINSNPLKILDTRFSQTYKIAVWNWESSMIPPSVIQNSRYYDEIWTPSQFCVEAFKKSNISIPVLRIPYVVELINENPTINRQQFGIPYSSFVFMIQFDAASCVERKNPYGVINAFLRAFSNTSDVMLIIKSVNLEHFPATMRRFQQIEADLKRKNIQIKFLNEKLTRKDSFSLKKSIDCFVSLHMSEGFGFNIAEAMYLRKPVIATGYSANMDFMTLENSFPVKYKLRVLESILCGTYEKNTILADPDLDHASQLMKFVFENRDAAKKVGRNAFLDIKRKLNSKHIGRMMKNRLDYIFTNILKNS